MPLWKSIVQRFDWTGTSKNRTVEVETARTLDFLEQLDTLLDESQKVVGGGKSVLTSEVTDMFEDKHSELYLAVVAVKSEVRDRQERDEFFSSPEEKREFYIEVQKLLRQCQSFHRDVLTASQRARLNRSRIQFNDADASDSSTSQVTGSNLNASWVAVTPSIGSSDGSETLRPFFENPGDLDPGKCLPYLANVVHIPLSALATEEELLSHLPDDDHYYRLVVCGNRNKRVVVLDPTLHSTKSEPEDNVECPKEEFLRVGHMLMQNDPPSSDDNITSSNYEGSSLVTSIFSLLSLNPSSIRLGGMV